MAQLGAFAVFPHWGVSCLNCHSHNVPIDPWTSAHLKLPVLKLHLFLPSAEELKIKACLWIFFCTSWWLYFVGVHSKTRVRFFPGVGFPAPDSAFLHMLVNMISPWSYPWMLNVGGNVFSSTLGSVSLPSYLENEAKVASLYYVIKEGVKYCDNGSFMDI